MAHDPHSDPYDPSPTPSERDDCDENDENDDDDQHRPLPSGDTKKEWLDWIESASPVEWATFIALQAHARSTVDGARARPPPPPADWQGLLDATMRAKEQGAADRADRATCIDRIRTVLVRLSDPVLLVEARFPKKKKKRPRIEFDDESGDAVFEDDADGATSSAPSTYTHKIHTAPIVEQCDFRSEVDCNLTARHIGILAAKVCALVAQEANLIVHASNEGGCDEDGPRVGTHSARDAIKGHQRGVGIVCNRPAVPFVQRAFEVALASVENLEDGTDDQEEEEFVEPCGSDEGDEYEPARNGGGKGGAPARKPRASALHRNPHTLHLEDADRLANWTPKHHGLARAATNVVLHNPNMFQLFHVTDPKRNGASSADAAGGGGAIVVAKTYRLFLPDVVAALGAHEQNIHAKRATVKSVLCRIVELYDRESTKSKTTEAATDEAVEASSSSCSSSSHTVSLTARNGVGNGVYAVGRDRGAGVVFTSTDDVELFKRAACKVLAHLETAA